VYPRLSVNTVMSALLAALGPLSMTV
jgi:hypothetical protein